MTSRHFALYVRRFLFNSTSKQVFIFMFFLVLSGIFWLILTLNESYEREIKVTMQIKGIPKNVVLTSKETDTLRVLVRDKGWVLVRYLYDNPRNININFKNYDRDNDGYVDLVYFIFAGNGSNYSGNDSRLFWPHRSAFYYFRKDGVNLGDYASSVELAGWTDSPSTVKIDGIGTICHEFSHVLGLPDFYDTDYAQNGQSNDPGDWSVMAGGSYFNDGRTPVGYSLFERFAVGFANVTTITGEGSYTLENIDNSNTGFRLKTSVDKESFYLENRQRTKWNYYLPGTGMLVFRVVLVDGEMAHPLTIHSPAQAM